MRTLSSGSPAQANGGSVAAQPRSGDAAGPSLAGAAGQALAGATEHLRSLQYPDGHWRGLLETNVTMDAEDMLVREFLGARDPGRSQRSARWIRGHQAADGSWPKFSGGPGDVLTTIEAYW